VPLVPFILDGIATDRGLMQQDGIHPDAAAQGRMLENVWAVLEGML
jgi:acyl-CoA thioesterase-1